MNKEFNQRKDYGIKELDIQNAPSNPIELLSEWLEEAEKCIDDANAFVLSTVSETHVPTSRVVLLRELDGEGIKFYTNYDSKKGHQMANNPNVAVNFFWRELERQVRAVGVVQKLSEAESDKYFQSRPRESQIGAIASLQSSELASRDELDSNVAQLSKAFENKEIPRPKNWGGYKITLNEIEFWQGRPSRLHDRLLYQKSNSELNWKLKLLYP